MNFSRLAFLAMFISGSLFVGSASAEIVYEDFYGTATGSPLGSALIQAQQNATEYARIKGYPSCTFVSYTWLRPNSARPEFYQVTAAYTCSKWVN